MDQVAVLSEISSHSSETKVARERQSRQKGTDKKLEGSEVSLVSTARRDSRFDGSLRVASRAVVSREEDDAWR